jgi:hypothetical protein
MEGILAAWEGRVMATFRICLTGSTQPLLVDLPASDVAELTQMAGSSRFLAGHMAEADEHGVCPGIMIQTNRIQCAFEA